jgi:hypothetical protein
MQATTDTTRTRFSAVVLFATTALLALNAPLMAQTAPWTGSATGDRVWTTNTNAFVGIGTTNPDSRLTIAGAETFRYAPNLSARLVDIDFNHLVNATQSRNGAAMRIDLRWDLGQPAFSWMLRAAGQALPGSTETVKMVLDQNGNLGIGTVAPSNKLEVIGNAYVSGTLSGGNIQANYQDLAEWVPASDDIPTATVVVLDRQHSNHVIPSHDPYDSAVAGVISEKPGIVLGERGSTTKVKVATTGRVKVKVDASKAAINIGDLLVTSDAAGIAMKSQPVEVAGIKMHRPGTVIGKALEPLAAGKGEILVLLSLQ